MGPSTNLKDAGKLQAVLLRCLVGHRWSSLLDALHTLRCLPQDNLLFMGIHVTSRGPLSDECAERTLDLTLHILANRCWSLATRYSVAPESYVLLLSGDTAKEAQTMAALRGYRVQKY